MIDLKTAVAEKIDLENLLGALSNFDDEDFNGNNGEDYLWESAETKGFKTNQDYVLGELEEKYKDVDFTKNENGLYYENIYNIVTDYLSMWLGNDGYYTNYEYDYNVVNDSVVISLVTETD